MYRAVKRTASPDLGHNPFSPRAEFDGEPGPVGSSRWHNDCIQRRCDVCNPGWYVGGHSMSIKRVI